MGILSGVLPSDVRQVIDRADEKMGAFDEKLSIIGDLIAEQNSLLIKQNELLTRLANRPALSAANGTPRECE